MSRNCGMVVTLVLAALLLPGLAWAEFKVGENILSNGTFELYGNELPMCWYGGSDLNGVLKAVPKAGPNGRNILHFSNGTNIPREVGFRQSGLKLVEGETYRVSALVRTKNLKFRRTIIGIANMGWQKDVKLEGITENSDWTVLQHEFTMFGAQNGEYFAVIYLEDFTGELDIAEMRLEAVSEGALKRTGVQPSNPDILRIVAWETLLDRIPADKPVVSFKLFGKLPSGAPGAYNLELSFEGAPKPVKQKLVGGENKVKLPKGAKSGALEVSIVHRDSGECVLKRAFHYTVIHVPKVSTRGHKPMNNLVTELLASRMKNTSGSQSFKFDTVRDGWVFIAVQDAEADGLELSLDGLGTVIDNATPRLETVRLVPRGSHVITVKGAVKGGGIVVRAIPDVFYYSPGHRSWEYQKKYIHPSVTTYNNGVFDADQEAYIKKHGQRWIGSIGIKPFLSAEKLVKDMEVCSGFKDDKFCGVTVDELFWGDISSLTRYVDVLRACKVPEGKCVYSWIVGKPIFSGLDDEVISLATNISAGRGMVLDELYCSTEPDEEAAGRYLDSFLIDTMRVFKEHCPHAEDRIGIILGIFDRLTSYCLLHHPEVDYK